MDLREIKKLISLMNENTLSRLEVEEEGKRYLLEKALPEPRGVPIEGVAPLAAPLAMPPAAAATPVQPVEDTVTVNSPIVGTFYRASSPEDEVFVKIGDHINVDSTVCIIEAMKVFNVIKAEKAGTIVEVLAENSEAVEYNQPLFLIKPD